MQYYFRFLLFFLNRLNIILLFFTNYPVTMARKYFVLFFILLFTCISCSKKEKFPSLNSEKMTLKSVVLNQSFLTTKNDLSADSLENNQFSVKIEQLLSFQNYYLKKNEKFDLDEFERHWNSLQPKIKVEKLNVDDLKKWIAVTGFLTELTGHTEYSEELEHLIFSGSKIGLSAEFENYFLPYVFTKDGDHVHVNLFVNATIQYEHSFFGTVKITQETNYPTSGSVRLKFDLEEQKYIELYIRIPDWAEGATVTVKKVKYVALPGTYSKIAKKWKKDDLVEIEFPSEKVPVLVK